MRNLKKPVGILLPAMRISFALALFTACLLLTAELLSFTPDESKFLLDARKQISESLAIQFSIFAPGHTPSEIQKTLGHVVKRSPEIESAGIRQLNGQLVSQIGDHVAKWGDYAKEKSTSTHLVVPILQSDKPWGEIEIKFLPLRGESGYQFYKQPIFKLGVFVLIVGFFLNLAFMLRTLKLLDPSAVIPDRVNNALDTLTEGIIILDENEQIVLANKAITEKLGRQLSTLMGKKLSSLAWKSPAEGQTGQVFPWKKVLKSGISSKGTQLSLTSSDDQAFKFVINASPIQSVNADTQGVLITLDDVTELEEHNLTLQTTISRLEETQALVQQQNIELNYLATRDSLTGCLNRRSFAEQFEKVYQEAEKNKVELSCLMADIDNFKKVNDTYGHATGDVIIKLLAEILQANTRKVDLVGRFGGEEFCVVLPGLTVEEAFTIAERIRLRLKDESISRFEKGPNVTASFGVASLKDRPTNPSELQKFADDALYTAKQSGRNRVVRWQPPAEDDQPYR